MKTVIVAEIGSNWEGSLKKAEKIIEECKKAGADIVKFQMWRAKDLYNPDHPEWKIIKKSELTFEAAKKIKRIADKHKIEFMCSVFFPEGVEFLESLGVKRYKVASRTCLFKDPYSYETLMMKAKTKKPVFVSMGMGGNKKRIEKIFGDNNITFCYCISEYPLKFEKINWKKSILYDGFSDHSMGITASIMFSILKKQAGSKEIMIEKHVKLSNSKGPDSSTSITTEELSKLVEHVRLVEKTKL